MVDKRSDITIIGGGLAGLTSSWSLQKEGYSNVTILEKASDTTMEASGLNSGVIRHYHDSPRIRRELRRGISLLSTYQTRHNTYFFEQKPSLWRVPNDQYVHLEQEEDEFLKWERVSEQDVPSQFRSEHPSDGYTWISFAEDALLDSVTLGKLLRDEVEHSSVEVRTNTSVIGGSKQQDKWKLQLEGDEELSTDLIINAAGAWANDVEERLGLELSNMIPLPRKLFLVENDLVPESQSYIMDTEQNIILRRSSEGTLISYAAEGEQDNGSEAAGQEAPEDRLNQDIGAHFPELQFDRIKTTWTGRYAMTPDRKPIIEPHPEDRSVIRATGLNDYGLSYGFHVGEKVLEFI